MLFFVAILVWLMCQILMRQRFFALLVGCGELRRLGGHNALIEGGSFSAIQWGSGNADYPWTMADRVEEIQYVSFQLKCEFNHVFR